MNRIAEDQRSMRENSPVRRILPQILRLAEEEGILDRMKSITPFAFEDLCRVLARDLGYSIDSGNRRRMIRVLLDILSECGSLRREGECWQWAPDRSAVESGCDPAWHDFAHRGEDDGQYLFFGTCLAAVPAYLRGAAPAVVFDRKNTETWERFLACSEFRTFRGLLLDLLVTADTPSFRFLDLCHGPGLGLEAAAIRFPAIRIDAIDFTDVFSPQARDRMRIVEARNRALGFPSADVNWHGPCDWKGFGHPLPFGDGVFDAVFFSCSDPYVPRSERAKVYGEIGRVLAPGGKLGILTRGYPDPGRRHVASFWMRMAALVHDFAESVCQGWEGFADVEENIRLFESLHFLAGGPLSGSMHLLEASLWLLKKGDSGD